MRSLPVLATLRGYQREWIGPDLIAGVALLAIAVPGQMATTRLAELPPVTGLYAFLAGSVLFAVLGSHPHLSVGADSTIAPICAAGVAVLAVAGTPRYAQLMAVLALMVGALVAAVGLLRLGWIADFLPAPVVTGFLAGIGVEIVVRQLPAVLGVSGGGTTMAGRLEMVFDQRGRLNGWSVTIAVVVLVVVLVAGRIDGRIPGALIGLVFSTAFVASLGLKGHGVSTVGAVHGGLPTLMVPSVHLGDVRRLLGPALTVTFVCVVQTSATARRSPLDSPSAALFGQDLVAVGAGSLVAGLTGSFPVDASPPNTAVVTASGGRSQLTGLVAAAGVVAVIFAAGILTDIPDAALGAILIVVATKLFDAGELRRVMHFDPVEFVLAAVTLMVVALVGIEQGVVVAAVLALAQRIRVEARPHDVVLGRQPGTDHWIPPDIGSPTEQVPGVVVYLLYAPLWYANASHVADRLRKLLDSQPAPVRALVLDANGISDIDYTGARALARLAAELRRQGVLVGVARSSHLVHHDLKRSGILADIGEENVFPTVQAAVAGLSGQP